MTDVIAQARRGLRWAIVAGAFALLASTASAQVFDTGTITAQDAGACATINACVRLTVPTVAAAVTVQVSGTFTGTLTFDGSSDGGTTWTSAIQAVNLTSGSAVTTTTGAGSFAFANTGLTHIRLRAGSFSSGTAIIAAARGAGGGVGAGASVSVGSITASGALTHDPDDASIAAAQDNDNTNALNMIYDGSVWRRFTLGTAGSPSTQVVSIQGVGSGTAVPVSGTFWQTTQPVSLASLPALAAGSAVIGHVIVDTTSTTAVTQATGTNLHMVCDSGCSSSTAPADNSAFTAGTTSSSPMSAFYHSTIDTVTDGRIAAVGMTSKRALMVSLFDTSGNALAQDTQFQQDTAIASGTIGNATGGGMFGRASAAAPTDVGADGRAVLAWLLKSGALVNNPSFGGTLALGGNGTSNGGVQRVTIASDSTGQVALAAGSATIGALTANQSVNVNQIGGVSVSTGVGAAGTGTQRVVDVASGTNGSTAPTQSAAIGAKDNSGNQLADIACTQSKIYDASTTGSTELVAISGSTHVYICAYEMFAGGTVNLSLTAGTGTACASAASGTPSTGTSGANAKLTPAFQFTTQTGKLSAWPTHGYLLDAGAGNAVCVNASQAVAAQVQIWYAQR